MSRPLQVTVWLTLLGVSLALTWAGALISHTLWPLLLGLIITAVNLLALRAGIRTEQEVDTDRG